MNLIRNHKTTVHLIYIEIEAENNDEDKLLYGHLRKLKPRTVRKEKQVKSNDLILTNSALIYFPVLAVLYVYFFISSFHTNCPYRYNFVFGCYTLQITYLVV